MQNPVREENHSTIERRHERDRGAEERPQLQLAAPLRAPTLAQVNEDRELKGGRHRVGHVVMARRATMLSKSELQLYI